MVKHIVKKCDVRDCESEATYWIDTSEGFVESLLGNGSKEAFYLCIDHQYELRQEEAESYAHLRLDTGEIHRLEIGSYSCHPRCHICND